MLRPAHDIFCNLYGTDGVPLLEENFESGKTQITFTLIDQLIKKVGMPIRNVFLIKISSSNDLCRRLFSTNTNTWRVHLGVTTKNVLNNV